MKKEIEEFDRLWKGRDHAKARKLAHDYVKDNRKALTAKYGDKSREEVIDMVAAARLEGREEERLEADMWLLAEFKPVAVVGSINLTGDVETLKGRR